jgi:hypothetical protein
MKEILNQIKGLAAGDLVSVEWCDASIGKSLSNGVSGIERARKSSPQRLFHVALIRALNVKGQLDGIRG